MSASIVFIIPAYNAAGTIRETLSSLMVQSRSDWKAIVVNDGSDDDTAAIVVEIAASDPRVNLIHTDRLRVSGARNAGLKQATEEWVCFLDADDSVTPDYVERMMDAVASDVDLVYCGYKRVSAAGKLLSISLDNAFERDGFRATTSLCPVAIHCVVARRQILQDAGGFDPALAVCEDWDLWQRVTRSGINIRMVDAIMAVYVMRDFSLSANNSRMLRDGLIVLRRGHEEDPRVSKPASEFRKGIPDDDCGPQEIYLAAWCASAEVGAGRDGAELLSQIPDIGMNGVDIDLLAQVIADGLVIGSRMPPDEVVWQSFVQSGRLKDLAVALGRRHHLGDFGAGLMTKVQEKIVGRVAIDIADIRTVQTTAQSDQLPIDLKSGTDCLATFNLATFGDVPASAIAEAALDICGTGMFIRKANRWSKLSFWLAIAAPTVSGAISTAKAALAARSLRHLALRSRLKSILSEAAVTSYGDRCAAAVKPRLQAHQTAIAAALDIETTTISTDEGGPEPQSRSKIWEGVFASPDPWKYSSSYEQRKYENTLDMLPRGEIGNALELACAEGHFTVQFADRVKSLIAADISSTALQRARERCKDKDNIDYRIVDLMADAFPGGQDVITCSEVLYYLDSADQLGLIAQKLRDALVPGGKLIMANHFLLRDDKSSTGFDWDQAYGAKVIYDHFMKVSGLQVVKSLITPLYRIDVFERVEQDASSAEPDVQQADLDCELHHTLSRYIVWGGAAARRREVEAELTWTVPVLAYHRVATDCDPKLQQWCVHPDEFQKQMRFLRSNGYHAINSSMLAQARAKLRPLSGRPVLITFDDGYVDTATTAWPILKDSDFSAEVFLVTDLVGAAAHWDAAFAEPAPLMDWDTIRTLHDEGMNFGSHLATHKPAIYMSSNDLLDEALRSRLTLVEQLKADVHSIAAPYGLIDERFVQICRLAGYAIGFSCNEGFADVKSPNFNMPRFEVSGFYDIAQFASYLGRN